MSEEIMQGLTEQQEASLPYYVHEGEMARLERANKRWFIAFIIVLAMLFVTNAGWIVYESQFETYNYEQETRSDKSYAVALMNTGEGSLTYNGNGSEAEANGEGQEDQQPEPDEAVPEM